MTLKINFNLNLPDSCCTLVPKNGVWTVPEIAACQIAKNAALLIPDYRVVVKMIFLVWCRLLSCRITDGGMVSCRLRSTFLSSYNYL